MIPGEVITGADAIELEIHPRLARFHVPSGQLTVANAGDRPIQVGSHYHFFETNAALQFDRAAARGQRLNIPAGTAIRFEPGQSRDIELVPFGGSRRVYGFNQKIMGSL